MPSTDILCLGQNFCHIDISLSKYINLITQNSDMNMTLYPALHVHSGSGAFPVRQAQPAACQVCLICLSQPAVFSRPRKDSLWLTRIFLTCSTLSLHAGNPEHITCPTFLSCWIFFLLLLTFRLSQLKLTVILNILFHENKVIHLFSGHTLLKPG